MDRHGQGGSVDDWLASVRSEWVVGTIDDAVDRLRDYEAAGVGRVMLQHQRHTDVDMVPLLGEVARRVGAPAEA
jgi:alkanesulfonate monooxygenase SsuD/methylene tetrahydromethanopterin reductase-like flavin-dependent oxidoreductase (luciferase family)